MIAVDAGTEMGEGPAPPFGLRDAEQIVRRLAPALREHGLWIQRIHTILICRTPPTPAPAASAGDADGIGAEGAAPGDRLHSPLGRWFALENNEYIRGRPDWLAAWAHYRDVHALAEELCAAAAAGRPITPEDYQRFAESIGRLDHSLEALVKELWDLLRYTDPLTGIATRFAMLPRLEEEHLRVRRTGIACTLCMVDLDHFKQINDRWGHHAGDAVLEAVSAYLLRNLRHYDQVCRYGGEEFVLMLPSTEPEQAVPIVDRLRAGLEDLAVRIDDAHEVRITASIGIAPLAADEPIHAAIGKADRAMYEAKRAGRNRVRVWRGE